MPEYLPAMDFPLVYTYRASRPFDVHLMASQKRHAAARDPWWKRSSGVGCGMTRPFWLQVALNVRQTTEVSAARRLDAATYPRRQRHSGAFVYLSAGTFTTKRKDRDT